MKMKSEGLEALEDIKGNCDLFDEGYQWDDEFSKQFDSDIDTIEKELKAMQFVFKVLNINVYKNKLGQCFIEGTNILFPISQEEYDLLKEVLL